MADGRVPRRRLFRFSLRFLALLVTVFTIWFGLLAVRASRQERTVDVLSSLGGQFQYDYQVVARAPGDLGMSMYDFDRPEPGPAWVRRLLSKHYLITPVELRLIARREVGDIPDKDLELLANLPELEQLTFANVKLSDKDVVQIPELRKLRYFRIEPTIYGGNNRIEDYGFLRGFPRLEVLIVPFSSFGDDDAEHISEATELRLLGLHDTAIGDAGLKHLRSLEKLEHLSLSRTRITDAGLRDLGSLVSLRNLRLNGTAITDEGLRHLRLLPKLERLELIDAAITEAGLEHLNSLSKLKQLDLVGTRISDQEAAELHADLPNCRIRMDWSRWIPP